MGNLARQVAILGATGSIGRSTLEVIAASQGRLRVAGLTANRRLSELCALAHEHHPRWVVGTDAGVTADFDWSELPADTELLRGTDSLQALVTHPEIDVVVAAIVGSAGLRGTWLALEAGKTVALANKETLVMAGPLVMQLAAERGRALGLVIRDPRALREPSWADVRLVVQGLPADDRRRFRVEVQRCRGSNVNGQAVEIELQEKGLADVTNPLSVVSSVASPTPPKRSSRA